MVKRASDKRKARDVIPRARIGNLPNWMGEAKRKSTLFLKELTQCFEKNARQETLTKNSIKFSTGELR
jgi:hypothetical protein